MGLVYGRITNYQQSNLHRMPWVSGVVVRGAEMIGYSFHCPILPVTYLHVLQSKKLCQSSQREPYGVNADASGRYNAFVTMRPS